MGSAAGLLTTSKLSLREIALSTGYDNEASLSKQLLLLARRFLDLPNEG